MTTFFNHQAIEQKWQRVWADSAINQTGPAKGKKKYILDMFPYPSADGLHVGHPESYTATDIMARYFRFKGFNVLHPMGFDSFGLPAENYAIKQGVHPQIKIQENIVNFRRQIKSLGFSYDWSREVDTSSPEYYKWTQWLFLKLYEQGLAYKRLAPVNWCPSCQTVLANEQVENGKCERCETDVMQKNLEQWFFKVTAYAEELLNKIDDLDYAEALKATQRNWIGKSEGAEIEFVIKNEELRIKVFTTRPDTIFGATYLVLAPEHELVKSLKLKAENLNEIDSYIKAAQKKNKLERTDLAKEKTGVELQGIKAINPANQAEITVWIADYVLTDYGTGAIMAVPAHDERDWEFAKKFNLPIKEVVVKVMGNRKLVAECRDGVAAVLVKNGKVAILYNKKTDEYRIISGGYEADEDDFTTLKREIVEESGYIDFEIKDYLGQIEANFFAKGKNVERHKFHKGYLVNLLSDRTVSTSFEEDEDFNVLWVNMEEAIEKLSTAGSGEDEFVKRVFDFKQRCFAGEGTILNSGKFDGLSSAQAKDKIIKFVGGQKQVQYKIRDWLVSRQRYWGAPIPIIYCVKCGQVPVPEKDLPVLLPQDVDFKPTGESPLARSQSFHQVSCPKCGSPARRESDTMDTFVCSSWYFLRYADAGNQQAAFSPKAVKYWLPVDLYIGGMEHAVGHLIYSRFIVKALRDMGIIKIDEPFLKIRNQGIILAEDGRKMSKRWGNVINPDEVVEEYGADTMRMYEMFMGPLEDMKPWNQKGIIGLRRFLEKIYKYVTSDKEITNAQSQITNADMERSLHKTIKKVTEDIENLRFNTAISAMMIFMNDVAGHEPAVSQDILEKFLIILSPFAPHLAEELWQSLGHPESIFKQRWPAYDDKLVIDEEVTIAIQINGKLRETIKVKRWLSEKELRPKVESLPNVKKFIGGRPIKKFIYIENKLVNIVA